MPAAPARRTSWGGRKAKGSHFGFVSIATARRARPPKAGASCRCRASAFARSNHARRKSCVDRSAPANCGVISTSDCAFASRVLQFIFRTVLHPLLHVLRSLRRYRLEGCRHGWHPSSRALRLLARRHCLTITERRAHPSTVSPLRSRNLCHLPKRETARCGEAGATIRTGVPGTAQGTVPDRSARNR